MSLVVGGAPNQSLLGTIGGVIGGIGGAFTGGVGGAIAGATAGQKIGDAIAGSPRSTPPVGSTGGMMGGFGLGYSDCPPGDLSCFIKNIPGALGFGQQNGAMARMGMCMKGYHLNKSELAPSKGGCGRMAHGRVPKRSVLVRNRHMNPGNAKAARRAIHRLKSAHRIFKKIDKIVGRHRTTRRSFGRKR